MQVQDPAEFKRLSILNEIPGGSVIHAEDGEEYIKLAGGTGVLRTRDGLVMMMSGMTYPVDVTPLGSKK